MTGQILSMPARTHAVLSVDRERLGVARLIAAVVLPVEAGPRASVGRHGG